MSREIKGVIVFGVIWGGKRVIRARKDNIMRESVDVCHRVDIGEAMEGSRSNLIVGKINFSIY